MSEEEEPAVELADPEEEIEPVAEAEEEVAAPAPPKFAELAEPSEYKPLPTDYAAQFGAPRASVEQPVVAPSGTEGALDERDLDVPTFMRRLQF
jgi:hypothetical protein